uniref:Pentacotripeptide-repeat region of PRORP domain-containing protein n=1 Tax=Daucus carota subsp. sativus TaxID=79200 RepID=A0A162AGS8_DAUCS
MPCSHLFHQLQICAKRRAPSQGKSIHAHIIKSGLTQYDPLPNTLVDMYGKCGLIHNAIQVFDEIPQRDKVCWASILTAHTHANLPKRTLSMFREMVSVDGLQPDHFVFTSLVKACTSLGSLRMGVQVHARFLLSCYSGDDVVKSSLVDMYAKCGLVDTARIVFDSICYRSSVSWTAMVSGYAKSGRKTEAIELLRSMEERSLFAWTALISGLVQNGYWVDAFNMFNEMRREGMDIEDPFSLSSIIGVSANLATLDLGKQMHCLVIALGYESSLYVGNALVDMYAKCSDVDAAKRTFDSIGNKDVVSWTSIIVGMAQHGRAREALSLYDKMVKNGVKPNKVTFLGLIYACGHAGLVDKGRHLFRSMRKDYGFSPSLQHYTSLLDLYSRSGLLDDAEKLLNTMPFEPDEAAWAALLSACKRHGKTHMGVRVADLLLNLEPKDNSTCIMLSNVYAGAGILGEGESSVLCWGEYTSNGGCNFFST